MADAMRENSQFYREPMGTHTRAQEEFQIFLARVLSVDTERKVCTLQDFRTGTEFVDVSVMPANASSQESSDVNMPEIGSTCLAAPLLYQGGFSQIAIIAYVLLDSNAAIQSVAFRGPDQVGGYRNRTRGVYRKAYQGQKTSTYTRGFSEKIDDAWDRNAKDLSRDKVDADRHSWTQMTGRKVQYTDAGLNFTGPVNRPGADGVTPRTLPDGTQEYVVYLKQGAALEDRYTKNTPDVIPFAEHTERIQEYSLDYPLPMEVLETDLMDAALGTTADPWARTTVQSLGGISFDDETLLIDQAADHPYSRTLQAIGPTTGEGPTPRRRAYIIERNEGTLVGYSRFDKMTYGKVLKPTLFPYTKAGRFGADVVSGYLPVNESADHVEARLAASAHATRFPHEYNTTRWDITKEGLVTFEIGATLPKENIPLAGGYEHPHGAGRSMEGHLVGSLKLVIGKNRDEEDSLDIQALGQTVLRMGADDSSLPNAGRSVLTQTRGQSDVVAARELQYWKSPKNGPGDPGDLENKTGAEGVSVRGAFDGGVVLRFGARTPLAKRRHFVNGYVDGQGKKAFGIGDKNRIDSHSPGRPNYGAGDSLYAFHDLTGAGRPIVNLPPFNSQGFVPPVTNVDAHGLSADVHMVRDAILRFGKNPASGQSVLIDTDGGLVTFIGKDNLGRSWTGSFEGGLTLVVGQDAGKKGFRMEVNGDVDMTIRGNKHEHITGDYILEANAIRTIAKTDAILTANTIIEAARTRHTTEAPDIVHNQGQYQSDENAT